MNVLLAVDNSPESRAAADLLQRIQFPVGSNLFLLYVLEPHKWIEGLEGKHKLHLHTVLSSARSREATKAWQFLSRIRETCGIPELNVTSLVTDGIPGGEILATIDKFQIDLVVLGTHGRTGLKRFLLGSVSEWVLTEAPCSVLIVRKESGARRKRGKGLNCFIANDGSVDATCAIDFVRQLKFPPASKVTVCHVIEEQHALRTELAARLGVAGASEVKKLGAKILQVRERHGKQLLNSSVSRLRRRGRTIKKMLAYGHPAEQVLMSAKQQNADVVIVGSRGITGLRRFFLGSVSNKVVSHAPCSVLVVRKSEVSKRTKPEK